MALDARVAEAVADPAELPLNRGSEEARQVMKFGDAPFWMVITNG